jgi:hypothetical protein
MRCCKKRGAIELFTGGFREDDNRRKAMRARLFVFATFAVFLMMPLASQAEHRFPPVKPATAYPNSTVHPGEQVAIGAVPYVTAEQQKGFAIPYRKFGFVPIRLIITNMGDKPVSLEHTRVFFISANKDQMEAATPEDVERNIPLSYKEGRKIPVGPLHVPTHRKDADWKVQQDFDQYEYNAVSVAPHSTKAGFLWYDMNGLGSDPLRGASLVVEQIEDADGRDLFYFRVPLDKVPR